MRIAVTGAFGYSGRYIAQHLLRAGHEVVTLTNSLDRPNPFGEKVKASPFRFGEPHLLRESLRGADALVNTYWVRFDHRLSPMPKPSRTRKSCFLPPRMLA